MKMADKELNCLPLNKEDTVVCSSLRKLININQIDTSNIE